MRLVVDVDYFWDQLAKKDHRGLDGETYSDTKISDYSSYFLNNNSNKAIKITYFLLLEENTLYNMIVDYDYGEFLSCRQIICL